MKSETQQGIENPRFNAKESLAAIVSKTSVTVPRLFDCKSKDYLKFCIGSCFPCSPFWSCVSASLGIKYQVVSYRPLILNNFSFPATWHCGSHQSHWFRAESRSTTVLSKIQKCKDAKQFGQIKKLVVIWSIRIFSSSEFRSCVACFLSHL